MRDITRRDFAARAAAALAALPLVSCQRGSEPGLNGKIVTVLGPIEPERLGPALPHEHILVDFIGADRVSRGRYDPDQVYETMLPYLQEIVAQGVSGFVECTPMYLGRDPELCARLSRATGLHILVPTGMYKEPYLPQYAFEQDAGRLASSWIAEFENGIEGTGIRPGFIKIAVFRESLKPMQVKIVRAACRTHLATGMTIACHTGHGPAAMEMLDLLAAEGVPPHALIVVHANSESDRQYHYRIAEKGAWLEYDNIGSWAPEQHLELLRDMLGRGYGPQILLSMDRGWYHVGEPDGGDIKPYTYLFGEFLPLLRESGYGDDIVKMLTVDNPARAFRIDAV